MQINPTNLIDWYKADHRRMYPEGTSFVFSNFTPRSSRMPGVKNVVFFGLQYFIKEYLIKQWNENFFHLPKAEVIAKYKRRVDNALGKDAVSMEHIAALHDLGVLPIRILALPEGSLVPVGIAPLVIYNTRPEGFWLPNYLETILSCSLWQACTSATIAHEYKKEFERAARESGGNVDFTMFQGHDFSFRGMSSLESACLSGAGHLLSFAGTDTVPAIDWLEQYYEADSDKQLVGVSVPATEHSVMSMGGQENEMETFQRLFKLYPKGILSVVSDTWDFWAVLTDILPQIKDEIMAREGKLVIRPDSSPKTPLEIICGDPDATPGTPEFKGAIEVLWDLFGGTTNAAGFRELDSHIGLIYGDSITLSLAKRINATLKAKGFASTNWVAGIGSFTYQLNTRDTFGFAMKATAGIVNDEPRDIFKNPKTDKGDKKSAKGMLAVRRYGSSFVMDQGVSLHDVHDSAYQIVFEESRLQKIYYKNDLASIRERLTTARAVLPLETAV
jgi:nicotinamide phosphoribosyltransferase